VTSLDVRSIEQEALDLTRELCRKPSVSAEERALGETADLVETLLMATGFETRQLAVDGIPPAVYGDRCRPYPAQAPPARPEPCTGWWDECSRPWARLQGQAAAETG